MAIKLADLDENRLIDYDEFCKLLDKELLKSDPSLEEAERILRQPLVHKNDLPTLIRKCFENNINLRELFKKEDKFKQGLIERDLLYQILENLPIGYSPADIYEIFRDSAIFDAHGNADYTIILQHEVYVILDKLRQQKESQTNSAAGKNNSRESIRKSLLSSSIFDSIFFIFKTSQKKQILICIMIKKIMTLQIQEKLCLKM